jgi:hypothetical protein
MSLSSLLRGSSIYMLYTHMAPCIIERYIQVIVVVQYSSSRLFVSIWVKLRNNKRVKRPQSGINIFLLFFFVCVWGGVWRIIEQLAQSLLETGQHSTFSLFYFFFGSYLCRLGQSWWKSFACVIVLFGRLENRVRKTKTKTKSSFSRRTRWSMTSPHRQIR